MNVRVYEGGQGEGRGRGEDEKDIKEKLLNHFNPY